MYYHDDALREWCQSINITYNGCAPLGDPLWAQEKWLLYTSLNGPTILNIAKKYNVSAAQINLKWSLQHTYESRFRFIQFWRFDGWWIETNNQISNLIHDRPWP